MGHRLHRVLVVLGVLAALVADDARPAAAAGLGALEPGGAVTRTNLSKDVSDALPGGVGLEQDDGSLILFPSRHDSRARTTRRLPSGAYDPSFGNGGTLDLPITANAAGQLTSVYSTGAGTLDVRRFDRNGQYVPSFGTNGATTYTFPQPVESLASATADDGTVFVLLHAGGTASTPADTEVLGLNPDGSPLATMGTDGRVSVGTATSWTRILAVGTRFAVVQATAAAPTMVDAFTRSGVHDSSFGSAGSASLPLGGLTSVAVLGDRIAATTSTKVVLLTLAGQPDAGFTYDDARGILGVARRTGGWAVVHGTISDGYDPKVSGGGLRALLASGAPDSTVGTGGEAATVAPDGQFCDVTWLPGKQRLLVTTLSQREASLRWLRADTTVDASLESTGTSIVPLPGTSDGVMDAIPDGSGALVMASRRTKNADYRRGVMRRVLPTGAIDTSFAVDHEIATYGANLARLSTTYLTLGTELTRFDSAGHIVTGWDRITTAVESTTAAQLSDGTIRLLGSGNAGGTYRDAYVDLTAAGATIGAAGSDVGLHVLPLPTVEGRTVALLARSDGSMLRVSIDATAEQPARLEVLTAAGAIASDLPLDIGAIDAGATIAESNGRIVVAFSPCIDLACSGRRLGVVAVAGGHRDWAFGNQGIAWGRLVPNTGVALRVEIDGSGRTLFGGGGTWSRVTAAGRPDRRFGLDGSAVLTGDQYPGTALLLQTSQSLLRLGQIGGSSGDMVTDSPDLLSQRLVGDGAATVPAAHLEHHEGSISAQHHLDGNDGTTWQPVDDGLDVAFTPTASGTAAVRAAADLWTATAGVNQDLGIFVTEGAAAPRLLAWKESGGFAGTFSPNAAAVSSAVPVVARTAYRFQLRWKANRFLAGSSIYVGAGSNPYSPTSLRVDVLGGTAGVVSSGSASFQAAMAASTTWAPLTDAPVVEIPADHPLGDVVVTANADLWTSTASINQDLGIFVEDLAPGAGSFGAPTLVAWKESGGFAGTFSPNAALVEAPFPVLDGHRYRFSVQLRANKSAQGFIWVGAGFNGAFSPTSLVVRQATGSAGIVASATLRAQRTLRDSDGSTWLAVDPSLTLHVASSVDADAQVIANADLWTSVTGVNQDLGLQVHASDGSLDGVVAWKESGGYGGTFSPNAASVRAAFEARAGVVYVVTLVWKANRPVAGSAIWAGAGPDAAGFSPTTLIAALDTPV